MDNLKLLSVIKGSAAGYRTYRKRPSHGLVFKVTGCSRYYFEECSMELSQGEIIMIPKGRSYDVGHVGEEESRHIVVNFDADLADGIPRICRIKESSVFISYITQLERLLAMQTDANKLRCMAIIYEIFAVFENIKGNETLETNYMKRLQPVLEFLQNNIFDPSLKIGDLHLLCGVSDTYFRKIFISCFGESPKKYILGRRLDQAKDILDAGEYDNIYDVAKLVGFEDALYFSKVFKTKYGYPPSLKY